MWLYIFRKFSVYALLGMAVLVSAVGAVTLGFAQYQPNSALQSEMLRIQTLEKQLEQLYTVLDQSEFNVQSAGQEAATNTRLQIIDIYNQIIDQSPLNDAANLAHYYNNRGITYAELGDDEKSLADINKALELSNDNAFFLKNRAIHYQKHGQVDESIADYEQFLKITSEFPESVWSSHREFVERNLQELKMQRETNQEPSSSLKRIFLPVVANGNNPVEVVSNPVVASSIRKPDASATWYGIAATNNQTNKSTRQVRPNQTGFGCYSLTYDYENAVWFNVYSGTRRFSKYYQNIWGTWEALLRDSYFVWQTGWTAYPGANYYVQIQQRDVCAGYSSNPSKYKAFGEWW